MLQKISTSNKCCSFELSVHQRILKKSATFLKFWNRDNPIFDYMRFQEDFGECAFHYK